MRGADHPNEDTSCGDTSWGGYRLDLSNAPSRVLYTCSLDLEYTPYPAIRLPEADREDGIGRSSI